MSLTSPLFLGVFLPLGVFLARLTRDHRPRWREALLLALSTVFIAAFGKHTIVSVLASALFNFAIAISMSRTGKRPGLRALLFWAALAANCALLFGLKAVALGKLFPIGFSFYTIRQIAYLIDVYQGAPCEKSPVSYFSFVLFFPCFLMGPILDHETYAAQKKQIGSPGRPALEPVLYLISGLIKKLWIADTLAPFVSQGFSSGGYDGTLLGAWLLAVSFLLQLYFDFSGYTDLAIGSGLLLGVRIPPNFADPFLSRNVIVFWSRWHMTLTRFLTTYLYTPLVMLLGARNFWAAMLSTLITMAIAGVWHGHGVTFLVFGLLHGSAMVANHLMKRRKLALQPPIAIALTFAFLTISFVVFRASSLSQASLLIQGMLGLGHPTGALAAEGLHLKTALVLAAAAVVAFVFPTSDVAVQKTCAALERGSVRGRAVVAAAYAYALLIAALWTQSAAIRQAFIYQFF